MPIGNYTSQFFANIYLNELDKYISEACGAKQYARYVDDLVIIHKDKAFLQALLKKIEIYLEKNLGQSLEPSKTKLKNTRCGIDFLGYFIKPRYSLVRPRVKRAFCQKLALIKKEAYLANGSANFDPDFICHLRSVVASYIGHFQKCQAKRLTEKIFHAFPFLKNYYEDLWELSIPPLTKGRLGGVKFLTYPHPPKS